MRNASRAAQDRALVESEKAIGLRDPFAHARFDAAYCAILGEIEEHRHQPIELVELIGLQVILGHHHIGFADTRAGPVGQPHVAGVRIRARHDQLGSGLAGDGKHQLVLDRGKNVLAVCAVPS